MNDATSNAAPTTATAIEFVEVEQPMQRRGTVNVTVTVEGYTTADDQPTAELIAKALNDLANGVSLRIERAKDDTRNAQYLSVTGVKLA